MHLYKQPHSVLPHILTRVLTTCVIVSFVAFSKVSLFTFSPILFFILKYKKNKFSIFRLKEGLKNAPIIKIVNWAVQRRELNEAWSGGSKYQDSDERKKWEKEKGEREIVRGSVRIKSIKKKVSYFPALILYFFSQFKEKESIYLALFSELIKQSHLMRTKLVARLTN